MIYLLDSNVWITVLRQPTSSLAARFNALTPADICICSVVVAELRYGCLRSAKPAANRSALDALLAPYVSLPFDDAAGQLELRQQYFLPVMGLVLLRHAYSHFLTIQRHDQLRVLVWERLLNGSGRIAGD